MEGKIYEFNHLYLGEFVYSCENVACVTEIMNDNPEMGPAKVKVWFIPKTGMEKYIDLVYQTLEDRYYGDYSLADAILFIFHEKNANTK